MPAEALLSILRDVSSMIHICFSLLFKDELPDLTASLEGFAIPDAYPSNMLTFVKQENLILIFC